MQSSPQVPEHINALKPYVPGLPIEDLARRIGIDPRRIAKLASNENPLGASPAAKRAISEASLDLSRYPDNECYALVNAVSQHLDVPPEWIVVGAGSNPRSGGA